MKKLAVILSMFAGSVMFGQKTFVSDPAHSRIQFSVNHLTISDVTGNFDKFDLNINANDETLKDAKINFSIDVASINTHIEARDNHLRNADFFDVEKFPKMTFKSTSIKKKGKNQFLVNGNLTLHGITKPITIILENRGTVENPMSKKKVTGVRVLATINRLDFKVGESFPEFMISNKVKIKGDFELGEK